MLLVRARLRDGSRPLLQCVLRKCSNTAMRPELSPEILALHREACDRKERTYTDPDTGLQVFTEYNHLERGECCGSACRHCAYNWKNVKTKSQKRSQRPSTRRRKSVPYTRTGDKGTSVLFTGSRHPKDHARFEALGTIDELGAFIGQSHAAVSAMPAQTSATALLLRQLEDVLSRLLDLGSHVATPRMDAHTPSENKVARTNFDELHIRTLEVWIDEMTEQLPSLGAFVLPTGGHAASSFHVARTVCRRAERRVITLDTSEDGEDSDMVSVRYLNRLSDFLFTCARLVVHLEGGEELQYVRQDDSQVHRSVAFLGREVRSNS